MLDMYSKQKILDDFLHPTCSVISNHDSTKHMYTCGSCSSWSYQDTLFTDYFSCVQCGYETNKVHHTVLEKKTIVKRKAIVHQ